MFQKTSLLEQVVAWFLMAGVWVLGTAGCGAMLALQDQEENQSTAVAVESCNEVASRVPPPSHSQPAEGPELEYGTRGLQARYLSSAPARAAYAYCLEDRDRWAALHVGGD
jgi:hypothetical protein